MTDLYREEILDHYHHPHNYGRLSECDLEAENSNPVCGDRQSWQIKLDERGRVAEVAFTGVGCALSLAAGSILSRKVKGQLLEEIEAIKPEEFFDWLNLQPGPARAKCLLLPLETIKRAIKDSQTN